MALNSRGEYDRCKIHRLTIEKEGEQRVLGEHRSEGTEILEQRGNDPLWIEERKWIGKILMELQNHPAEARKGGITTIWRTVEGQKRGNMLW